MTRELYAICRDTGVETYRLYESEFLTDVLIKWNLLIKDRVLSGNTFITVYNFNPADYRGQTARFDFVPGRLTGE